MADIIGKIVEKAALQQVADLKKELNSLLDVFVKVNAEAAKFKPSKGNTKPITDSSKALTELEKITKSAITAQNKLTASEYKAFEVLQKNKLALAEKTRATKEDIKLNQAAKGSYDQLNAQLNKATASMKAMSAAELQSSKGKALQAKIQALDAKLKALDATMGRHTRNVGNYGGALRGLRGTMVSLGQAMGVTFGLFGAVRLIRNATGIIRDFEKANATLSGVLQLESDQMKELTDDSKRLGETTVKTAGEVVGLQVAFARLGFSQEQILKLSEPTISGSIAMNSALDETATLVGAVVNSFDDFSAADAPLIIDQMSLATAKSALDFKKLETSIPIVAGAANAAGIPFSKLLALLGKLSDSGIDASSSANALKRIFIESRKAGLDYGQILDTIKNSNDKLTASVGEFGVRAAVSANVLAKNIDATLELDDALQGAAGTADKMAKKELATLDGALKLLNSAWEGYILGASESTSSGKKLTAGINFLSKNLSTIINVIAMATAAWIAYKIAVGATAFVQGAYSLVTKTAIILEELSTAAKRRAVIVQWQLNKAIAANPLGVFLNVLLIVVPLLLAFAAASSKSSDALNKMVKNQKDLNDALSEGAKSAAEEISNLETLYARTQDTTLSLKERTGAVKELQKLFPAYFGDLSEEIILTGKAKDVYNELEDAILASAHARAIQNKLTERAAENLDEEEKIREKIAKAKAALKKGGEMVVPGTSGTFGSGGGEYGRVIPAMEAQAIRRRAKVSAEIELKEFKAARLEENRFLLDALNERMAESAKLRKQEREKVKSEFEADSASDTKKDKKKTKDKVDKDKVDKKEPLIFKDIFGKDDIKAQGKEIEARVALAVKQYYDALDKMLGDPDKPNQFRKALEELQKGGVEGEESAELLLSIKIEESSKKKTKEDLEKFIKELNDAAEALDEITGNLGSAAMDAAGIAFDRDMANLDARSKALERANKLEIDGINQTTLSQEEKQKRLQELEATTEAKRQQLESQRKEALRKQAAFEKAVNIASIITGTARAVIAALGFTPFTPLNIAIAASVGIAGAAQLARAIAAPLPQYAQGTQDHKGGMAVVGDGGRKEVVQTPDGKTYLTPDKSTIVDLPQHTKVFKDVNTYLYQNPKSRKYNSTSTGAIVDFEETNKKLDSLINITKRKSMSVNLYGDKNFTNYESKLKGRKW